MLPWDAGPWGARAGLPCSGKVSLPLCGRRARVVIFTHLLKVQIFWVTESFLIFHFSRALLNFYVTLRRRDPTELFCWPLLLSYLPFKGKMMASYSRVWGGQWRSVLSGSENTGDTTVTLVATSTVRLRGSEHLRGLQTPPPKHHHPSPESSPELSPLPRLEPWNSGPIRLCQLCVNIPSYF